MLVDQATDSWSKCFLLLGTCREMSQIYDRVRNATTRTYPYQIPSCFDLVLTQN